MARNDVFSYDTNADLNLDVAGISLAEGWKPSDVNNVLRTWFAQWASFIATPLLKKVQNLSTILGTETTPLEHPVGYRDIPSRSVTAAATIALGDAGGSIKSTTGGLTIPLNSAVAMPIDNLVVFDNRSATAQTITPATGVTLRLLGTTTVGTRTVAAWGCCTLRKLDTDEWGASGAGVS